MEDLFETLAQATRPEPRVIEKLVTSWKNTDKHACLGCRKKLSPPDYTCNACNIKLKLKMQF